jgi:cobalt/nickel transport system permease protein
MTSVVAVQGLLFQDGGLLVMGANILNMGLITALIGYGLYKPVAQQKKPVKLVVIGVAAWLSVMAAAFVTSLQLWLSGTSLLGVVMPAMLGVHALIGIGEAFVTVGAVALILQTRPELMAESAASGGGRGWVVGGVLASLAVLLLSPLASAFPDGLERVAEDLGFLQRGADAPYTILPDYTLPFLGETSPSTILAGVIGAAVVAGVAILLVRAIRVKTS